ncbi:MAG: DUF6034 family protein [Lachnospiraceae bacterium]|nr:DUF6034 family protein [Lachnospiraceae bacterium]
MLRRKVMAGMSLCMVATLFSGCGTRTVDYNVDDTEVMETEKGEDVSGLAQFVDGERWTEELSVTGETGGDATVSIHAKVVLPDMEQMSVVEVKRPEVDAAYREALVNQIFGSTPVYYYEDVDVLKESAIGYEYEAGDVDYCATYLTGQQLQELLTVWEMIQEEWEDGRRSSAEAGAKEQALQNCREQIRDIKNAMRTAPEDYVPVTDYESDSYLGYLDTIPYCLKVTEGDYTGDYIGDYTQISLRPLDYVSVCPEEMEQAALIHVEDGNEIRITGDNQCELSEEEAEKMAEVFLWDMGIFDELNLLGTYDLYWFAYMEQLDHYTFRDDKEEVNGYAFYYGQREGNLTDFPDSSIVVYVNDGGVFSADIVNPYQIISMTEHVPLLPLDTIQQIMQNEMAEHADDYFLSTSERDYTYQTMELLYARVADDSRQGYYSFVPVWKLDGYDVDCPVMVNAIDGGIVNAYY